jgi:hypothetical protein
MTEAQVSDNVETTSVAVYIYTKETIDCACQALQSIGLLIGNKRITCTIGYDYDDRNYWSPFAIASFRFVIVMQMTTEDLVYLTFAIELPESDLI